MQIVRNPKTPVSRAVSPLREPKRFLSAFAGAVALPHALPDGFFGSATVGGGSGGTLLTCVMAAAAVVLLMLLLINHRQKKQLAEERRQLAVSNERFRIALANTNVSIWDYDFQTRTILQSADTACAHGAAGVTHDVPEGMIRAGWVHPDSVQEFREMYQRLFSGEPHVEGVFRLRTDDGAGWWYGHIRYTSLFDPTGKPYRAIGMSDDVTEKQQAKQAAKSDSMTGMLNHESALFQIDVALRTRQADAAHALFVIDIDHFKRINDTFGHQAGDTLIKEASRRIRGAFRETDIFGRIGGDEFIVLMKHAASRDAVVRKADELIAALRFDFPIQDGAAAVSGSAGVCFVTSQNITGSACYQAADEALYRAKQAGRNRWEIASAQD